MVAGSAGAPLDEEPGRAEDDVPGVVAVPVVVDDPLVGDHPLVQRRSRVRREDVERRRLDPLGHRPLDGAGEDVRAVVVHAEHEAAVHHHPVVVQLPDRGGVVATEVVLLALAAQVGLRQGLEADEETAQTGRGSGLDHAGPQHGLHRGGTLEETVRRRACRRTAAGRSARSRTGGRRGSTGAGRAGARSPPGRRRFRHQIVAPLDQVAVVPGEARRASGPSRCTWRAGARPGSRRGTPARRPRPARRRPCRHEPAPRPAARSGAGRRCRRGAARAVQVRQLVGPSRRGDVRLDHDQLRVVVEPDPLDVLVLESHLVVGVEVRRQRRQPQRREQRVLHRAEERARRLGERREHHLHPHDPR